MIRGWLIYNKEDYQKNKTYADRLIRFGEENGLEIKLYLKEELILGISNSQLVVYREGKIERQPEFVINRTRDTKLANHFELQGISVFNSSKVTEIANDKGKTHQFVNALGVPSVETILYHKGYMKLEKCPIRYPFILKSVDGHGGNEVFYIKSLEEAKEILEVLPGEEMLIQEVCNQVGIDVRVFVIGNQIVGAIKRHSEKDFRSNYSLGGQTSVYPLNEKEKKKVHQILDHLMCDFVGIDFMIDAEGEFIFNEIEDVVGSRSLYANTDIDSAKVYIMHIKQSLGE